MKASAGGGGRGMRIVRAASELAASVESAKRSPRRSGDNRMLIEKLVENPRHIEAQVIGDSHGNLFRGLSANARSSAAIRR